MSTSLLLITDLKIRKTKTVDLLHVIKNSLDFGLAIVSYWGNTRSDLRIAEAPLHSVQFNYSFRSRGLMSRLW